MKKFRISKHYSNLQWIISVAIAATITSAIDIRFNLHIIFEMVLYIIFVSLLLSYFTDRNKKKVKSVRSLNCDRFGEYDEISDCRGWTKTGCVVHGGKFF